MRLARAPEGALSIDAATVTLSSTLSGQSSSSSSIQAWPLLSLTKDFEKLVQNNTGVFVVIMGTCTTLKRAGATCLRVELRMDSPRQPKALTTVSFQSLA